MLKLFLSLSLSFSLFTSPQLSSLLLSPPKDHKKYVRKAIFFSLPFALLHHLCFACQPCLPSTQETRVNSLAPKSVSHGVDIGNREAVSHHKFKRLDLNNITSGPWNRRHDYSISAHACTPQFKKTMFCFVCVLFILVGECTSPPSGLTESISLHWATRQWQSPHLTGCTK